MQWLRVVRFAVGPQGGWLILAVALVLVLTGCQSDLERAQEPTGGLMDPIANDPDAEERNREINNAIRDLELGERQWDANAGRAADASLAYDNAVRRLTREGTRLEPQLIEELQTARSWGVRMGIIDVLMSVGTVRSIPALIERLTDEQVDVALRALFTLRVMTGHRVAPRAGETNDSGVAPEPDGRGLTQAEQQAAWEAWFQTNGPQLRAAWTTWWDENENTIEIQ